MTSADQVIEALNRVTAALPAAEQRDGQQHMAVAVSEALDAGRPIIVQAGTGTGKTFGYMVPAILSGKTVVVATATKALQDQVATKDMPLLQASLQQPFTFAVLKGRSNYICMQRLRELQANDAAAQLELDDLVSSAKAEVGRLATWAATSPTGDLAELDWTPSERAWQTVSVGGEECPGAQACSMGKVCFTELARDRAETANVVVVNLHLYGLDVAADGAILPTHQIVVIDEAHQLEDIMSDSVGAAIGPFMIGRLIAALRKIVDDPTLMAVLSQQATQLRDVLTPLRGQRVSLPLPAEIGDIVATIRLRLNDAQSALADIDTTVEEAKQRKLRAQTLVMRAQETIDVATSELAGYVAFVSGSTEFPRLELAPLDVGPVLSAKLWPERTAVLCSATIPTSLAERVGLPATTTSIDVGSPFEYQQNALLYCARHLPPPNAPSFTEQMHDELIALMDAAGGRTLALFTSWKAMEAAATAAKARSALPILTQRDLPKPALVKAFSEDESACLFATAGFFQGVDIPGRTLSLVTIDRIPFPRPDDPLLSARREQVGPRAFATIDIPRAAMLLAQATGRLIRTSTDRGVVAVFDRRLSVARYGWDIVSALPPMRRTRQRADAEAFLRDIT